MRILLLNPNRNAEGMLHVDPVLSRCVGVPAKAPYLWPPMGLAYLTAHLRQEHEADFLDAQAENLSTDEVLSRIEHDLVFINAGTPTIESDLLMASIVRDRGSKTAMIGTHATCFHDELIRNPGVDFIIRGEPERPSMGLSDALESGGSLSGVPGLTWKRKGTVIANPENVPIRNLDKLPYSVRDFLPNKKYFDILMKRRPGTFLISSRGCPFSCRFCSSRIYSGKVFRSRSANSVLSEAAEIRDQGFRDITFIDDTFTIDRRRVLDISRGLGRLGLSWRCLSRVDTVDQGLLRQMKENGCYQIQFGVESGDQRILGLMRKGITKNQVRSAFRHCDMLGIETVAFFVIGYPGEGHDEIARSIRFSKELRPDFVTYNVFTPIPGSDDFFSLREGMRWSDYDFTRTSFSDIPSGELESKVSNAYRDYYINPRYILRRMSKTGEPIRVVKQNLDFWKMRSGVLWDFIKGK